jgi:hypothetical protein
VHPHRRVIQDLHWTLWQSTGSQYWRARYAPGENQSSVRQPGRETVREIGLRSSVLQDFREQQCDQWLVFDDKHPEPPHSTSPPPPPSLIEIMRLSSSNSA